MQTKVLVLRALAAIIVKKALRLVLVIVGISVTMFLVLTWLLALNFSGWWWWLLIPFFFALIIIALTLTLAYVILRIIYPYPLHKNQKRQLESFSSKIQQLLEARTMGWPLFLLICVKDLVLYKELRSLKQLIHDSSLLKKDFAKLEETFTD